jgi:hypothetical protein
MYGSDRNSAVAESHGGRFGPSGDGTLVVFRRQGGAADVQLDVVELPVVSPRSRRSTPAN